MEQKTRTDTIRRYYEFVDADRIDDLLSLFHDEIVYERQGTPDIVGRAALREFYETGRIIEAGRHTVGQVLADDGGDWVAVRGRFQGVLKDGTEVDLRFTDWVRFRGDRIDRRETLFPSTRV